MGFFSSISPKAHGAYLGAGTAAAISNVIIQLLWPHGAVPAGYTQLVYAGVGIVLAGFGAWIMPSGKPANTVVALPAADVHPLVPNGVEPPPNIHVSGGGSATAAPGPGQGSPG
jgi:hypothetical protein